MNRALWIAFPLLVMAGCAQGPGAPCTNGPQRCPANQFCVPNDLGDPNAGGVCVANCERRSECPAGQICRHLTISPSPVCDLGASFSLGQACSGFYNDDPCAVGLVCLEVCRPQCDPLSVHSEDRACPAGWLCNTRQHIGDCQELCDPGSPDPCMLAGDSCVRFRHPSEGVLGLCIESFGARFCEGSMAMCNEGQVCVEETCYAAIDAPARDYQVSPAVPALLD